MHLPERSNCDSFLLLISSCYGIRRVTFFMTLYLMFQLVIGREIPARVGELNRIVVNGVVLVADSKW